MGSATHPDNLESMMAGFLFLITSAGYEIRAMTLYHVLTKIAVPLCLYGMPDTSVLKESDNSGHTLAMVKNIHL